MKSRHHLFRSKVISTSGLCRRHFEFLTLTDVELCRPMSAVAEAGRSWSKMWRLPLESRRYRFPFKRCFTSGLESAILNSGSRRCRIMSRVAQRGRAPKYEGYRWNFDDISFNSRETMHLWFSRCFPNKSSCFWSRDRRPECHVTTAVASL